MRKHVFISCVALAAIALICYFAGCQASKEYSDSSSVPTISQYYQEQRSELRPLSQEMNYPRDWKEYEAVVQMRIPQLEAQRRALNQKIESMQQQMFTGTPMLGYSSRSNLVLDGDFAEQMRLLPELYTVSTDEVWVIVKPEGQQYRTEDDPGCGAMLACFPDGRQPVAFPLVHTDVIASVNGYIASVDVTQQFHNPYVEKIEAEYVFPLPQNAAVNEFVMKIGSRSIRGIIREKEEAEQIYEQAKSQGYTASLLTQERPNIFTQKVANIESQQSIHVQIHYFSTLAYVDGWYEFVFPMVVGPRFNPPHQTNGIGAVPAGARGASGQSTEVQYLAPGQRSGHDIALAVHINAGTKIETLTCPSHDIVRKNEGHRVTISLDDNDTIPNKDFVLRYKVAGDTVKSAFLADSDKNGNYFTLMLYPPEQLSELNRAPVEMVFVLDCSGSMSGQPLDKSKDAVRRALKKLQPDDTFQIIRFSDQASSLGHYPVAATRDNIRKGLDYVDSLRSSGGTMMINGIKAALDYPHDARRIRLVSFMTDGYIGNEAEILAAIAPRLGRARVFSFGIGSSVNRYLLDRMAKLGNGAVAYIGPNENPAEAVDAFYDRICHPALSDISIDWGGMQIAEMYPSVIPDLFVGRPVILTGRFTGSLPAAIQFSGRTAGSYRHLSISVVDDAIPQRQCGISSIWARKKIEDLALRSLTEPIPTLNEQIKQTALDYSLMSAFTAFVAVDTSHQTEGDHGVSVTVPVPMPEGVRYDTTVSGRPGAVN